MTTDWWNTSAPQNDGEEKPVVARGWDPEPEPVAPPRPPEPPKREEPEEPTASGPDRRKTLLLGAAGAAVAGIIIFAAVPHGESAAPASSQKVSSQAPDGSLPAAGGGPAGMPEEDKAPASEKPRAPAPKIVTISASPAGSGQVGAVVEVVIHNGTDDTLTVMPSLVKGDGRPAVIGEGTLAPGLLKIEPGETGKGTVEFATKKAPAQVALVDLSGNMVAAS